MSDHDEFEHAIDALRSDVTAAAALAARDASVRETYRRTIEAYVADLRQRVLTGRIGWHEACLEAHEMRNTTMGLLRGRSSPLGQAMAEHLKATGRTLNELVARTTTRLFGEESLFESLDAAQKDEVYAAIVAAAARSRPSVNILMLRVSRLGRGLLVASLAISIYRVATSDAPARAALEEGTVTATGLAGAIGGGAAAGLVCGPGAPVCVGIGAFVGGALFAFGTDSLFH